MGSPDKFDSEPFTPDCLQVCSECPNRPEIYKEIHGENLVLREGRATFLMNEVQFVMINREVGDDHASIKEVSPRQVYSSHTDLALAIEECESAVTSIFAGEGLVCNALEQALKNGILPTTVDEL